MKTNEKRIAILSDEGEGFDFGGLGVEWKIADFDSVPHLCERFGLTFPDL
jgi:hypothetical protein